MNETLEDKETRDTEADGAPDPAGGEDDRYREAEGEVRGEEAGASAEDDDLARRAAQVAEEACDTLLRGMDLDVRVLSVPGDPVRVEIQGEDAGRVIGRHGVTLQAIQYLVSRIVGQQVSRHVRVKIDVEGYRVRRENALRVTARRAADRAVAERRPVSLDPMPADERRVVHMALADDRSVRTESEGEGESRRVRILPVDDDGYGDDRSEDGDPRDDGEG